MPALRSALILLSLALVFPPREVPSAWQLMKRPSSDRPLASPPSLDREERGRLAHPSRARKHLASLLRTRRFRFPAGHHEELLNFWVTPLDSELLRAWAISRASLMGAEARIALNEIAERRSPDELRFWLRLVNRRPMERDAPVGDLRGRLFLEVDGRFHSPLRVATGPFLQLGRGRDLVVTFPRRPPEGSPLIGPETKKVFFHVTGLANRRKRPSRVRLDPKSLLRP